MNDAHYPREAVQKAYDNGYKAGVEAKEEEIELLKCCGACKWIWSMNAAAPCYSRNRTRPPLSDKCEHFEPRKNVYKGENKK